MPTTWPAASTSGPPELPDEIAAGLDQAVEDVAVLVTGRQRASDR
jgi:hypothetical protein